MKVKQLIYTLEKTDIVYLKDQIKRSSNKKQFVLFEQLLIHDEDEKDLIFKKVFGVKYTKEKDYLFRNELRHLHAYIEDYIIIKSIRNKQNKHNRNILLLQYYIDSDLREEFEREWLRVFNLANIEANEVIDKLLQLRLVFLKKYAPRNIDFFKKEYVQLQAFKTHVMSACLLDYYTYQQYESYITDYYRSLGGTLTTQGESKLQYIGKLDTLNNATQIAYYKFELQSADASIEQKHSATEKLVELCNDNISLHISSWSQLGVNYMLQQNYTQAYDCFLKAKSSFEHSSFPTDMSILVMLFNFMSVLMLIDKSEEAIACYETYQNEFDVHEKLYNQVKRLIAIAYLYNNKFDKINQLVQIESVKMERYEYYYFRSIYILGSIITQEYDLALREAENAVRTVKTEDADSEHYIALFKLLKNSISYKQGIYKNKNQILESMHQNPVIGEHVKKLITNML